MGWVESMLGSLDLPPRPSEQEFVSCLRNGLFLCNLINKIQPGAVPRVMDKLKLCLSSSFYMLLFVFLLSGYQ